jgi:hypothetical protein
VGIFSVGAMLPRVGAGYNTSTVALRCSVINYEKGLSFTWLQVT